jgi:hypothetical protein
LTANPPWPLGYVSEASETDGLHAAVSNITCFLAYTVAGALSGYYFSQAFLASYLSQLEREGFQRAAAMADHDADSQDYTPATQQSP